MFGLLLFSWFIEQKLRIFDLLLLFQEAINRLRIKYLLFQFDEKHCVGGYQLRRWTIQNFSDHYQFVSCAQLTTLICLKFTQFLLNLFAVAMQWRFLFTPLNKEWHPAPNRRGVSSHWQYPYAVFISNVSVFCIEKSVIHFLCDTIIFLDTKNRQILKYGCYLFIETI